MWRPAGPVRFVVPYPPGGTGDILARLIAPSLTERLGQPVIVDNKPGATGSIGSGYAYMAPADGSTLLLGVADSLSIYPHLAPSRTDVTKFVPVAGLAVAPYVLMGRPDLPAENLQELLSLMRKQSLSYASAGSGSGSHMMVVALANAAKVDNLLHVPYNGMAPALQALLGKQVDFMLLAAAGAGQYRSRFKFYGVSSASRSPTLPEIPTLTEQGLPLVKENWLGVLAPPNTSAAISAAMAKAIGEVTASAEFKSKVAELGLRPMTGTQSEFARYYLDEHRKWGELVRSANIKLD